MADTKTDGTKSKSRVGGARPGAGRPFPKVTIRVYRPAEASYAEWREAFRAAMSRTGLEFTLEAVEKLPESALDLTVRVRDAGLILSAVRALDVKARVPGGLS